MTKAQQKKEMKNKKIKKVKAREKYYCHYVSLMFNGGTGAFEVLNDIKQYTKRSEIQDLRSFLIKENNLESGTIMSILSVENDSHYQ